MTKVRLCTLFAGFLMAFDASAFSLEITADQAIAGEQASSQDCKKFGEAAFTDAAGLTYYSDEYSYSGSKSLKMTVKEGSRGFGTFGGLFDFTKCDHAGGRNLVKGDEVWLRARMYFPEGFEFNRNGRNKFLRFRTYHDENGKKVSEGYNDLYLNGYSSKPFQFIFEGVNRWVSMGTPEDFFQLGKWKTVEFYLKFDNKTESEGGDALVRVWIDGKLIGETGERATLVREDSYIETLNFFTYWDNDGAHQTQSVYVDDLFLTTDVPGSLDSSGNRYIGMGEPRVTPSPSPPGDISVR